MHQNSHSPQDIPADMRELIETAKTIDGWSMKQRKDYLFELIKREQKESKTFQREIMKRLIVDSKGRKEFIKSIEK